MNVADITAMFLPNVNGPAGPSDLKMSGGLKISLEQRDAGTPLNSLEYL